MSNQLMNDFDLLNAAMDAKLPEPNRDFWGQVDLKVQQVALVKGVGKVPFDPGIHKSGVTAIDIFIYPLAEMGNIPAKATERNLIAESKEWINITLDSLKKLGVSSLAQVPGKYVHVVATPTGETYEKNGETREKTQFSFVKIFTSQAECQADYFASTGGPAAPEAQPAPVYQAPAPANGGNGNGNNLKRETAKKFLPVIVENACRGQTDLNVIRQTIALNLSTMPMVGEFFTADSPEVIELTLQVMSKGVQEQIPF